MLSLAGEHLDLDPLAVLLPPTKVKFHDIVDFVESSGREQEQQIWEEDNCQLVIKSGAKRLALENVLPMQWSAANQQIMFTLIKENKLQ